MSNYKVECSNIFEDIRGYLESSRASLLQEVISSNLSVLKRQALRFHDVLIDQYTCACCVMRCALQTEWMVAEISANANQLEVFQRRACTSMLLDFFGEVSRCWSFDEQVRICSF